MKSKFVGAAVGALACLLAPAPAAAQVSNLRIGGQLQEQFSTVSGDTGAAFSKPGAGALFEARRARFVADGQIGSNVTFQVGSDFADATLRMLTAWMRVALARDATSGLGVTIGQQRKPFNRYELTSSQTLVVIERGARFRGLAHPAVQDNLLQENGYTQLDMGAMVDAYLLSGRMTLQAGVFNGSGESAPDVNTAKTFAGRVALTAASRPDGRPRLRLGAAVISRDRGITADSTCTTCAFNPDSSRRSLAWEADAEWGDFSPGLHVVADFSTGDNLNVGHWTFDTGRDLGNLRPNAPDSALTTFRAFQVVASWRWQRSDRAPGLVRIVEPAVRVDLTDPNTERAGDAGMLLTGVLNLHFTTTTALRAGYSAYRYHEKGQVHWVKGVLCSWQVAF